DFDSMRETDWCNCGNVSADYIDKNNNVMRVEEHSDKTFTLRFVRQPTRPGEFTRDIEAIAIRDSFVRENPARMQVTNEVESYLGEQIGANMLRETESKPFAEVEHGEADLRVRLDAAKGVDGPGAPSWANFGSSNGSGYSYHEGGMTFMGFIL